MKFKFCKQMTLELEIPDRCLSTCHTYISSGKFTHYTGGYMLGWWPINFLIKDLQKSEISANDTFDHIEGRAKGSLDTLKLDRLPAERYQTILHIIFIHCTMWNKQLDQINTKQYRTKAQIKARPYLHWPCHAGPVARAAVQNDLNAVL